MIRQKYELAFFEYHCWESHESDDAQLWYRSHQPVMILRMDGDRAFLKHTEEERYESACLLSYRVRFADGFEATAMEDELLDSEADYCRADPPPFPPQSNERKVAHEKR